MTDPNPARGNWMFTFSGQRFHPLDPRPEEIHREDIAHSLSLVCRFGGHSLRFYSVAEHCVLMSRAVSPEAALHALLHDATEAYVGDMVRPLKRAIPHYEAIEDHLWLAVIKRFDLYPDATKPEVKEADNRILLDESAAICNPGNALWGPEFATLKPLGVNVQGWSPEQAEYEYLYRLDELGVL